MITWHIHIKGLVQGVGFRPHVFRLARQLGVKGSVNNTTDGVHIMATASAGALDKFYHEVVDHPPANARVTYHAVTVMPAVLMMEYLGPQDVQVMNGYW